MILALPLSYTYLSPRSVAPLSFESECCRDSSNARELLKHTKARGQWPWGFELGNELAAGADTVSGDRTPQDLLDNWIQLHQMIQEIWTDVPLADRPKLIGPDNGFSYPNSNVSHVLDTLAPFLHAFTYHKYGGGDVSCLPIN